MSLPSCARGGGIRPAKLGTREVDVAVPESSGDYAARPVDDRGALRHANARAGSDGRDGRAFHQDHAVGEGNTRPPTRAVTRWGGAGAAVAHDISKAKTIRTTVPFFIDIPRRRERASCESTADWPHC